MELEETLHIYGNNAAWSSDGNVIAHSLGCLHYVLVENAGISLGVHFRPQE